LNEINLQHQNIAMRLSTDQVQAIRRTAQRVLGTDARVRVFGSMAQDDRKIDVILKDANTPPAPIFEIAQRTGVLL
jgi:hypothetical protein